MTRYFFVKNIIIFLLLVFSTSFVNATNFNSTSTEARKMFKLCPSANLSSFKSYKNIFLKEERFKNYKNIFLAENKDFFYYLLKNDFNGNSLRCMGKKLLDNKEVILDAITINNRVFEYVSERLKKDKDVVLNALKALPYNMRYVDKSLLNDKEIVLLGLKNNGMFLQNVDEKLKNDKDVVRVAFKARPNSLQFASDALKNDREYMLELAKINHYAYDYIGDSLKKDKELAMIGLVWQEERLKDMDYSFRDDPKMVLKAMEQDIKYLQFGSKRLRNDKEFVLSIVTYPENASTLRLTRADAIKYVTKEFKNNKQIMLEVINKNALTYRWIGESLKEDRDVCLATVQHDGNLLKYLSPKCSLDREIIKAAVKNNGHALYYASKIFRNDKEIVEIAVKSKGIALKFASLALKKDKELIDLARKGNIPYVKSSLKRMVHPDAWESYMFDDTLEILYGKNPNFVQGEKLKVTGGIKIETDLKLKSIAILQDTPGKKNLIAWNVVHSKNFINISVDLKYAKKYTIIGEGLDGKLYVTTHEREEKYYGCGRAYMQEQKEYDKFFNTHLKRKITHHYDYSKNTSLEFMIVNETKKTNFITKVRIEVGGKTMFTMYTSEFLTKNPYFIIKELDNAKKEKITIFCTDVQHRKEYVWEDKINSIKIKKTADNKNYKIILMY